MRILYVEDDEAAVEAARMHLSRASPPIDMEAVPTMREGLSRLRRRHDYDLVLTDMRLPDGDGLAVLAHIRGRSLPVAVVVTTGAGDEESAVAALKAGADDYITKRPGYLAHLPQRLLEAAERRRSAASRLSRPLRVLYLEDSPHDRDMAVSHLARTAPHIQVEAVSQPAELMERLRSGASGDEYDVLLLDYKLPGTDGLELLAELRRSGRPDTAVVLLTAAGNEEIAVQALRMGGSDYVVKRNGYLLQLPSVLENAYYRTSLQRAHSKLLQSEEKYRTLVEHLPVAAYTTTADRAGVLQYVGPQIKDLLGYTPEEWLVSPGMWDRSLHPEDEGRVLAERQRCDAQGVPFESEYRMLARDGQVVWVQDTAHIVRDASGQPAFRQGVVANVTQRKEMEMALRESEARYRDLFENANDIVFILDLQGRFLTVNRAGETATGYLRRRDQTLSLDQLVAPEYLEAARQAVAKMAAGGDPLVFELDVLTRDGRRLPLEVGTRPIVKDGQPVGVQGIARDISERKEAEKRIRRQLARLSALRNIDMAITGSLDLRVTLNVLLDHVTAQLSADAADVLLLDPHSQHLEYSAGRGFRTEALRHTRLRVGEGHAGRAALERRMITVPSLASDPGDFARAALLAEEDFLTYCAAPLLAKGQVKGVLEVFHRGPHHPDQEWLDFLEALAGQAAIAIDNEALFDGLQRSNTELALAYDTTLEGWARAMDLRDKETEGHSQRVAVHAVRLGRAVGLSEAELVHVRRGALLHDIGKLAVPDSILLKPGPLDNDEWEIMRKHPVHAYEMLAPIAFLRLALDIPYCHHEKWDGTGYPRGLKAEQIPLPARVFAVADVWEALTSDRPYRAAWPSGKALEHISRQSGKHFDPRIVEGFLKRLAFESS